MASASPSATRPRPWRAFAIAASRQASFGGSWVLTEAAKADRERSRALMVLLAGACVIGLAPILVRLAGAGPSAVGFWRLTFSLPLLAILARRNGGVGAPTPLMLLAGLAF